MEAATAIGEDTGEDSLVCAKFYFWTWAVVTLVRTCNYFYKSTSCPFVGSTFLHVSMFYFTPRTFFKDPGHKGELHQIYGKGWKKRSLGKRPQAANPERSSSQISKGGGQQLQPSPSPALPDTSERGWEPPACVLASRSRNMLAQEKTERRHKQMRINTIRRQTYGKMSTLP